MVFIKDQNAINEYRKRRKARLDEKNWIDELNYSATGDVEPTIAEAPKTDVVRVRLSEDMRPLREYRFLNDGKIMQYRDWLKANKKSLEPVYENGGIDAVEQEYYKGLMVNASRGLHRDDGKIEMDEEYLGLPSDGKFRRRLVHNILSDRDARNVALNIMYDNYCEAVDGSASFEEFLNKPVKVYKITDGDIFSSYSFMNEYGDELEIRPIDTFGSIRPGAYGAVMVPEWRTAGNPEKTDDGWGWKSECKWVFEEKDEEPIEIEILDAIEREAEMVKLFADDKSETGRAVVDRCVDSIHRYVKRLAIRSEEVHTDSAFFAGELDDNLGENEVLYPEVQEYRERRQRRLDAKEEVDWITVNGNHIPVDENGKPVGGQKKALGSMSGKAPKKLSESEAARLSKDYGEISKRLGKSKDDLRSEEEKVKQFKEAIEFAEEGRIPDYEKDYDRAKKEWEKIKSGKAREELKKEKEGLETKGLSESVFINSLTGKPPSEDSLDRKRWEKTILDNAEEVTGYKMPGQGTQEYEEWKAAMLGSFGYDIGSAVAGKLRPKLAQKIGKISKIQKELELMDKMDAEKDKLDKEKDRCALLKKKLADRESEVERLTKAIEEDEKKLSDGAEEWKNAVNTRFPTYNDCVSADDIEEKLRANGCVAHDKKVDLTGIPIESARMTGNAVDEFYQKIPMAKGKLGSIIAYPMGSGTYAGSVSGGFGDEVYLNSDEKHFGNYEKLKEAYHRDVEKKFHPEGTGEDLVLKHELAHKLDSYLTRTLKKDAVGDECKDISTLVLEEVSEKLGMDEYEVKAEVSGYARKRAVGDWDWISPSRNLQKQGHFSGKDLEFFAEALGEYLSSPNPRRVAVEVWNAAQKYIKQAEERERNVQGGQ